MLQVYDSLFLLISKRFCLQLLSSNLCNYSFPRSRLLTVSFFCLLFFYPTFFLPTHHAAIHHAVTHYPSIYVYGTMLCSVFLYNTQNCLICLLIHRTFFILLQMHISEASSLLISACVNFHLPRCLNSLTCSTNCQCPSISISSLQFSLRRMHIPFVVLQYNSSCHNPE